MSASVLEGKTVRELIDSSFMEAAPQVHLHFLTDEEEYETLGFSKLELCCHSCGAAQLIYYFGSTDQGRLLEVRDAFVKSHQKCPNRRYEHSCPEFRSSITVLDLRGKAKRRALRTQTHRVFGDKKLSEKHLSQENHRAESIRTHARGRTEPR